MDQYRPISCEQHSEYERLVIQQQRIQLVYHEEQGQQCSVKGLAIDVFTRKQEEFLRLQHQQGMLEIRLDRVIAVINID